MKTICQHCKKEIDDKVTLSGMTIVCPHCNKPSGNGGGSHDPA